MVSLADALVTQKTKGTTRLEKIYHLINWQRFGYRLDKILSRSSPQETFGGLMILKLSLEEDAGGEAFSEKLSDSDLDDLLDEGAIGKNIEYRSLSSKTEIWPTLNGNVTTVPKVSVWSNIRESACFSSNSDIQEPPQPRKLASEAKVDEKSSKEPSKAERWPPLNGNVISVPKNSKWPTYVNQRTIKS